VSGGDILPASRSSPQTGSPHSASAQPRIERPWIVPCYLPVKAPWLNAIEPKWVHAKRRVVEPARLLPAAELIERVCSAFDCAHHAHLIISANAA
jgi:hypothetical protein